jgi:putative hemolysin
MHRLSILLIALCVLAGCQPSSAPPTTTGESQANQALDHPEPSARGLPNPADEKCLRDGYELRPILVNGIPVASECVNPKTGKACRTWDYFHQECQL